MTEHPLVRASAEPVRAPLRTAPVDWFRFAVVSAYLAPVGVALVVSRRVALGLSARQVAAAVARRVRGRARPVAGVVREIRPEKGHCYLARVPPAAVSDSEGRSTLQLWEDGRPLGPAHSGHEEVRAEGRGRYSHWSGWIYFSSSDNSDPCTNGRTYHYAEQGGEEPGPENGAR